MESTSLSENILKHIADNFSLDFNQRGNPKIDDFSLSGNGLPKRFVKRFLSDRKTYKNIDASLLEMSDSEIIEEVSNILPTMIDNLKSHITSTQAIEFSKESGIFTTKEAYLEYIPIVDMEDPKGSAIMVNNSNGRISTLQEKAWERIVGQKHVKMVAELGHCGLFEYNPKSTEAYLDRGDDEGKMTIFNKFIPPTYRLDRNLKAKLDPRFIEFLEGFFKDTSRKYAYNWLYHSAFSRVPVYLVLVGAGGIGKNLLAEALKNLHGDTNFTKAPPSALDTKFNGHLENCTMLYYDECKFSAGKEGVTTRKNRLKEWANDYVPVEKKGIDSKNMDIFCSAVIATNNDSDVHLEQLDRKFSVMELSEERLEKRLGLEITQFLWEYIRSADFPDAFLNWLETKIDPDFNPHVEYKGPKFDQLVLSSLYGWQQELLDRIKDAESKYISIKDCRENISLFPKHTSKVDDFLKNFTWEGHKLGKVVIIQGSPKIKINEALLPKDIEDSSLDKGDL